MLYSVVYPTDLTDEQWDLLRVLLPKPRPAGSRGRPRADMRKIFNGLLYYVRAGCAWRLLPKDFGPYQTVNHYFRMFKGQGHWQWMHDVLRGAVRESVGKRRQPTAAILDSQTVRSADQAGERGYDGAKKTKGIKRHILVDTLGLLLAVFITPADVPEREGARGFLGKAFACFRWLRCIWADSGYNGPDFASWVAAHRKSGSLRLEVVTRDPGQRGFSVVKKRWIVERTFGWFMQHRRLVRHYEVKPGYAEAWLHIAMIGVMLRRLA